MSKAVHLALFSHDSKIAETVQEATQDLPVEMIHVSKLELSGSNTDFGKLAQNTDISNPPIVFFDTRFQSQDTLSVLQQLHASSWIQLMLLSDLPNEGNLRLFSRYGFLNHILGRNNPYLNEEIRKVIQNQLYPVPSTLSLLIPETEQLESMNLKDYRKRDDCLNSIYDAADDLNCFPDFPGMVTTAAAEIIMNAFFHAPFDLESGKEKYGHLPRSHPLVLEDKEEVKIQYGSSEDYFAFSVVDPFGRLEKKHLASCFNRGLSAGNDQINLVNPSAGVGFFLTVNSISQIIVNVNRNQSTEITCLCLRSRSRKKFENSIKSIHFFDHPEEVAHVKVA
jgi:hypothetical protein